MDLYIYYRVPAAQTRQLHGKIKALQAVLQGRFGIAGGLKRRPGEQDGLQTWMEVYEHIAPGQEEDFSRALERALDDAGVAGLIEGPRHVERFEDVATCA
ncbi:DUF4936 family protein [Herbaspirillum robiniae]|uniref:DUF4936 domain-containing protein n=1 Tax=Herbaspirillum robiniae TaxID=2014887 RepID=A0A2D0B5N0_9BURK|nr:DUF4936 family protein [Herbaspirillum robiniae]NUU03919.1 DUF4936 family protein [Herbaspirillum robiniae]OWY29957.1 DUF4936 domain-containing protein [Herbaspirillum robiniae]